MRGKLARAPKEIRTEQDVRDLTYALFEVRLKDLAFVAANNMANTFISIPDVTDVQKLREIEQFYQDKLKNMDSLVSIYKKKFFLQDNVEKRIVIDFLDVVENEEGALEDSIKSLKTLEDVRTAFANRIQKRLLELEALTEKSKAIEEDIQPQKPEQMTFKYKNSNLNEDVRKRLEKIARKNKVVLYPIENQDWNVHLANAEKNIKKLSQLYLERKTSFERYSTKYAKPKMEWQGEVKYSAEQRLENYDVKARLYKDMQFSKDIKNDSYDIKEVDPETKVSIMEVLIVHDKFMKSIEIVANKIDNEDHYILTMVEQARAIVKQLSKQGKDPGKISIEIAECAPETAIKLKNALEILGLVGVYDAVTKVAIEKYEEEFKKPFTNN